MDPASSQPLSDLTPSIVARLREGDEQAAAMLDAHYRPLLVRFCGGYLGRREAAEDVVQDVFCKVLQSHTVPRDFRAWVYRIARNRCLDVLRRRARRRDDAALASHAEVNAELTGHLSRLVREEVQSRLREVVDALPPHEREILRLRYTERLSRAEIGQVLDLPEKLVKSRLFETLEKLRRHPSQIDPA